jgi:hypothetical protein
LTDLELTLLFIARFGVEVEKAIVVRVPGRILSALFRLERWRDGV